MKVFVPVLAALIGTAAAFPSADKPDPYRAPEPSYPAPAPKYQPAPAPKYEPAPAPKYEPAPAPKYEPAPAPKYEPAPAPKYEPAPKPVYKAAPAPYKPKPAYRPAPAPYQPKPSYQPAPYKPKYEEPELPPQPYQFEYGVADGYTGTQYKAVESQDAAGTVLGSYSVNLPDGRVQTVTYKADGYEGFTAEVTYEGEAQYPPEPAEGYGNSYKKHVKEGYAPPPAAYKRPARPQYEAAAAPHA